MVVKIMSSVSVFASAMEIGLAFTHDLASNLVLVSLLLT